METRYSLPFSRWWLIVSGAFAMGVAGTFQFVWSSIRGPLGAQIGATETTVGTLFTIVIATQTLSQLPAGWFRDRHGPRIPIAAGGVFMTAGFIGIATATGPIAAGLGAVAGGIGSGIVYTVAVNTPVKWFDERRGLATGVLTMSYALLSFALIPVVRRDLLGGLQFSLFFFAGLAALTCLLGAVVLRDPDSETATGDGEVTDTAEVTDGGQTDETQPAPEPYNWRQAVGTWQFWVLYVVFVIVNGVGLMLIGKLIAFAEALELSTQTATLAASVIAVADGAGGVVVGGLSDRFGPLRTAGTALLCSGAAIAGAVLVGSLGLEVVFVVCILAAGFFRSPVFAIFPTVVGEYYGRAYSSENYAVLYTSKLWGSVFAGTVASVLIATIGWSRSFLLGAGILALSGLLLFTVRPVERGTALER
jgi:OFA family oxalate/formate antiporter-like MFS transporter